jgi:hypothetical protein
MIDNIIKIQKSYGSAGPTTDNSSRIALFKKVQTKTSKDGKRVQLWGLNNMKGNVSGSNGDAGQRIYFSAVFPRFSF